MDDRNCYADEEDGIIEVWVLLSRHVRERKRDLSQKYLAVHVHSGQLCIATWSKKLRLILAASLCSPTNNRVTMLV